MSNQKPLSHPLPIAIALSGLLFASAAGADSLDTWNVNFGTSVSYDNNLFRLPASADSQALIGSSSKSDIITATNLGLKVSKPYSLQRFELDLNLVNYNYKKFDYLNFTATNYAAAWRWSLTPYLHGNLSSGRQESLNSFTDNQNFRNRNVRTNDDYRFDADLDLGAGWHLLGGVFSTKRKNSAPFIQERDNTVTSGEFGGRYDFTSGTSLGFLNRTGRGTYDNLDQPIPFPVLLDNKFDQVENLVFLSWPITAKTSLSARIGQLERKHDNFAARDYSGTVGAFNVNWEITEKTRIGGGWARNLSSYETLYSSYSRIDRYFLSPVWQISAKTALRFRYDFIEQDYLGAIAADPSVGRRDKERVALIAFDWKVRDFVSLTASLTDDKRNSNIAGRDFKDRIALLGLQFSF